MTPFQHSPAGQPLRHGVDYIKFMAAGLPSFILAIPLNYMLVEWAALPKSPAYALVLAFQVAVNFFVLRRFVFRERTGRSLFSDFMAFFSGIMLFRLADFLLYSALVYYAGARLCAVAGPRYYLAIQLANVALFSVLKFLFTRRLFRPGAVRGASPASIPPGRFPGWLYQLAAWAGIACWLAGIAAAGLAAAGVVALAAGAGGSWAHAARAIRPIYLVAASAACFLGWYALARGIRNSLADWVRFAARMLFLCGAIFAGIVLLLVYTGGAPWAFVFYADKPFQDLALGAACFLGWYLLAYGIHNRPRDWGLFAGRMLLLACSIGLSVLAAEIGVRACLDKYCRDNSFEQWKKICAEGKTRRPRTTHPMSFIIRPCANPRLVYELQPDLSLDFGHRRLKTNSAGMRASRDYSLERLPRSVRILGIGDSGMFGWDLEQDEDYLAVLERNLNDRRDGVVYEALNMAVPGYNTQLEAEALRSKGVAYQPDIVIVGWCDNDYSLPFFLIQQTNFWRRDRSFLRLLLFDRKQLNKFLGPVEFRELRKYEAEAVQTDIADGSSVEGVRQALREIKRLSQQHDFRLLVFGPMDGNCVKICQEEAIPYLNIWATIPVDKYPPEYAVHFMHPAKEGHAVLARELEQCLDKRGWLKPK